MTQTIYKHVNKWILKSQYIVKLIELDFKGGLTVTPFVSFVVVELLYVSSLRCLKCLKLGANGLMPAILVIQEAEIRRIELQIQPGQIVPDTPSWKTSSQKKGGGVVEDVCSQFKLQYCGKMVYEVL
jgi:hypothetical protein